MSNAENEIDMERVLDYEEFKDYLLENIRDYLPRKYADADVSIKTVQKQGGIEYDALLIRSDLEMATPSIPLEGFYDEYASAKSSLLKTMMKLAIFREEFSHDIGNEGRDLTDFENVKDAILPKLVNVNNNRDYLKGKAYTMFNDMAVIYVADLGKTQDNGHMNFTVTDSLLDVYGISKEELHDVAVTNLSEKESDIKPLLGMLGSIGLFDMDMTNPMDNAMYVVTNHEGFNGANMLLNQKAMDELSERMGGDFAIIPSSVHECIAIPAVMNEVLPINDIICEVNATTVAVEDRLSDHVYMYDADEHTLMVPQEYELVHSFDSEELSSDVWERFRKGAEKREFDPANGSFHGEAAVYEAFGIKVLESFEMPIALSLNGRVKLLDNYPLSRTSKRHVLEFANQEMGYDKNRKISDIPVSQSRIEKEPEKIPAHKVKKIDASIDWFGPDLGMAR